MGIAASAACCVFNGLCASYSCVKCCCTGGMGAGGLAPWQAKIFYVIFLGIGTVFAFLFARLAESGAEEDNGIIEGLIFDNTVLCEEIDGEVICSGESAILRASFSSVLFFVIMFAGTIPVPTIKGEDNWAPILGHGFHRGFWGIKILVFFGLMVGSLFFGFFNDDTFTSVARFVSLLFLVMQVLVLIDFGYIWNDTWVERSDVENDFADGSKCWLITLLTISAFLYLAGFGGVIAILVLYKGCSATIGIAASSLVLMIIGVLVTVFRPYIVDDEVPASVAPAAVVCAYVGYLVFSAAQSNPDSSPECDPFDLSLGQNGGEIFLSLAISTATLLWTAFTVSSNASAVLSGKVETDNRPDVGGAYEILDDDGNAKYAAEKAGGNDDNDEDDVSDDKVWFFHLIMITASFYMSMALTNWGVSEQDVAINGEQSGTISMFVKAAAGWAAASIYIWTIVAPAVLPDRDW